MRFRYWFEADLKERAHMAMWNDFKSFIARGSVIDLAIGMIVGAAFTTVVKSLVSDIIMPLIGIFTKGVDFSNLYINLSGENYETLAAAQAAGAATINYGLFINSLLHFLIIAVIIFLMIKGINRLKEKAEDPDDSSIKTPQNIVLLREIRDALIRQNANK